MSLNRIALRAATVLALKGRTQAAGHVYDSRNDPLEQIAMDSVVPVIAVYTEVDKRGERRELTLVIEFTVNIRELKDGEDAIWVPQTDDGMELTLDLVEQEIRDALEAPVSDAADIWHTIVTGIVDEESKRGVLDPKNDIRLAARQITMRCTVLKDTVMGQGLTANLERLFCLMEADVNYAPVMPDLRLFAARQSGRATEFIDQARLRLNTSTAYKLGVVPSDEEGYGNLLEEFELDGETITATDP